MPSSTAIYAILNRRTDAPYIDYAIRHLRPEVDRLILVVEAEQVEAVAARYADLDIAATVAPAPTARSGAVIENPNSIDAIPSIFAAWMAGVAAARAQDGALGHLILTGSLAFGPIDATPGWLRDRVLPRVSGAWSPYPLDLSQHHHLTKGRDLPTRALHRDMIVFAPALTGDADFLAAWDALAPDADPSRDLSGCDVPLARHLAARGTPPEFDEIPDGYHSGDPGIHECHKVVRDLGLTVSRALLHLDPILHDLGAIYTRQALDTLEARNPELAAHVRRYAVRHLPSRNFNTIADQYEVLSERAASPDRGEWGFGTVALFIHAFYADMMPQFWELIDRLPCPVHLYISTATEPDRAMIEGFLRDRDWPEDRLDVRVVEVNRGRDMASLFITFRDVVLEDRHEVALRLHSKRTPQVSRQVGESFRDHLFENLVATPGYVSNLLDMMEASPDIGLVIPPVIHVGFGTLGHSWFNNRAGFAELAEALDLDIPLDRFTPVTAYGTMYWFRPKALRKMFAHDWRWDAYNPEPRHIDGGLAHVQERLIGPVVQDAGYRTMTVMTPRNAGRNYARLEYKHQLLSGHLSSANVYHQVAEVERHAKRFRMRLFIGMRETYGAILRRYPGVHPYLRPLAQKVYRVWLPAGAGDRHD